MTTLGLIIDGILILLLVSAIAACVIVYRRLEAVRQAQNEMGKVVSDLNRAVTNAQTSVSALRTTAMEVEKTLGPQVQEGRKLADELLVINDAANNLADRIERGISAAKADGGLQRGGQAQPQASSHGQPQQTQQPAAGQYGQAPAMQQPAPAGVQVPEKTQRQSKLLAALNKVR